MDVLLTGAFGRVGTAVIDHLSPLPEYEFTFLDRTDHPEHDTIVADISDAETVQQAAVGMDAVVHLAGDPATTSSWSDVLRNNIVGFQNVLDASARAEVESFVFASSNHVVGMYEIAYAPELYSLDFDLTVDNTVPHRPDSYYGTSKAFGEDLGRYFVEHPTRDGPDRFYALRIGAVRHPACDHPFGDAERGAETGRWAVGSDAYREQVARMRAIWQSRRDAAHMIDCCLRDGTVDFDVFYGVSDNDRRWFDIDHARDVIGYDPQDNGEALESPPDDSGDRESSN